MQISFNGGGRRNEDEIRMAKEQWEATKAQFKQLKPKDVVLIILVLGFSLTLLGVAIYGGIIEDYLLIGIGVGGFVVFLLSLAAIEAIRKKSVISSIKRNPMAQDTQGIVKSKRIYSAASTNNGLKSVTLEFIVDIGGTESVGYYKLSKEEIQEAQGVIKIYDGNVVGTGNVEELNVMKEGDKFLVKYIPHKPKTCIILEKIASIDSKDYYGQF